MAREAASSTRTLFNYRLVFWSLATLIICGTLVHILHAFQMDRHAETLLEQAQQADAQQDLPGAKTHLARYLIFVPGDNDARARYALLLDRGAKTWEERWQVLAAYNQVLAQQPSAADIRFRLVKRAMELGQFAEAKKHLEILIDSSSNQAGLADLLGQCLAALGDFARSAQAFEKAIVRDPAQIDSYVRLAEVLRHRLDQPDRANKIMDELIKTNAKSARAFLLRAQGDLRLGKFEHAALHAGKALQLAPTDSAALEINGAIAQIQGQLKRAREYWTRGLKLHPNLLNMYLGLAHLEYQAGNLPQVTSCLLTGLQKFPNHPAILYPLADAYFRQARPQDVAGIIARLHKDKQQKLLATYFSGRLLFHEKKWQEAKRILDRVANATSATSDLACWAFVHVGICHEMQGDSDQQATAYRKAVVVDPHNLDARLALASYQLANGKIDQAVDHCRWVTRQLLPPQTSWALLARSLIEKNKQLARGKRAWREIQQILDRISKMSNQAEDLALLRGEILAAQDQWEQAGKVLAEASKRLPTNEQLWKNLAVQHARQGNHAQALQILAEARQKCGDSMSIRLACLEILRLQGKAIRMPQLEDLEKDWRKFPLMDQARLIGQLANAYFQIGKSSRSGQLCQHLAKANAGHLPSQLPLLDFSLQTGQVKYIGVVLTNLERIEGKTGSWSRYAGAARTLLEGKQGLRRDFVKTRANLNELLKVRPDWARIPLLLAQIAELEKKRDQALKYYLKAIELGEVQPEVVFRVVGILAGRERFAEADRIFRLYEQRALLNREQMRWAANLAWQARNLERAIQIGQLVVTGKSRDYRDFLWLGEMLFAAGQPAQAEELFDQALENGQSIGDAWVAMANYLGRTGQGDKAAALLKKIAERFPPAEASFLLARCQDILGHSDQAQPLYQSLLKQNPGNFIVLLKAAEFFLRSDQPAQAEKVLRQLLNQDLSAPLPTFLWARRELALAIADQDSSRIPEAIQLLDLNLGRGNTVADRRAKAFVQGRNSKRRSQALRAIEESADQMPLSPQEKFRLIKLRIADNDWLKAQAQMISLLELEKRNPTYLAFYIRLLIDRGKNSLAQHWLDKLEDLEPTALRTKELRLLVGNIGKKLGN